MGYWEWKGDIVYRFHLSAGTGLPVARHLSVTLVPSLATTSVDVSESSIFGGTKLATENIYERMEKVDEKLCNCDRAETSKFIMIGSMVSSSYTDRQCGHFPKWNLRLDSPTMTITGVSSVCLNNTILFFSHVHKFS